MDRLFHGRRYPVSATVSLYHAVLDQLKRVTAADAVRESSLVRLGLLVTGIVAAKSGVLNQVAQELHALGLTQAHSAASIGRRLRRTLNDDQLTAARYRRALRDAIDWDAIGQQPVRLVVDESSQDDRLHLFRVSFPYWGASLPIAWDLWQQNVPTDAYWPTVTTVLNQVAAWLPPAATVIVLADRAYDIPAFIDRLQAHHWHWIIRCKARSELRLRTHQGDVVAVKDLVAARLPTPGQRFKTRGQVFKDAGWRDASLVACWAPGEDDPLVLLSDLPPAWRLLRDYTRRFWIEPGFRNDKTRGWRWEDTQVQGIDHHQHLLLAMAWASLLMLCLGVHATADELRPHPQRRLHPTDHPRASLFTLGLYAARAWLYRTRTPQLHWHLPDPLAGSWSDRWRAVQIQAHLALPVRP